MTDLNSEKRNKINIDFSKVSKINLKVDNRKAFFKFVTLATLTFRYPKGNGIDLSNIRLKKLPQLHTPGGYLLEHHQKADLSFL